MKVKDLLEDLKKCDLLNGIDDKFNLDDDEAYELARELCEDVVNSCNDSNDAQRSRSL